MLAHRQDKQHNRRQTATYPVTLKNATLSMLKQVQITPGLGNSKPENRKKDNDFNLLNPKGGYTLSGFGHTECFFVT